MTNRSEHRLAWNDRLLDWLDGDVEAGEQALIEAHLGECGLCQAQLDEFRQLDDALRTAAPPMSLDASFDERLYDQIGALDAASEESRRAQARERIEQELQQNLHALSRGWRRALGLVIPAVIASVSIAFMLSVWLDNSGVTQQLVAHAPGGLAQNSALVHWGVIALLGTSLGVIVSRWLASVVD